MCCRNQPGDQPLLSCCTTKFVRSPRSDRLRQRVHHVVLRFRTCLGRTCSRWQRRNSNTQGHPASQPLVLFCCKMFHVLGGARLPFWEWVSRQNVGHLRRRGSTKRSLMSQRTSYLPCTPRSHTPRHAPVHRLAHVDLRLHRHP